MGVFYGNFNPDATFTSDIGSITRLATSAPFGRYLQEEIFQQSAFYTSGILAADARLKARPQSGTRLDPERKLSNGSALVLSCLSSHP